MKTLIAMTALALLASAPAYAISDDIATANNGSVANTGTINGSNIVTNSGAGAGASSASVKNTNVNTSASSSSARQQQKQGQVQFSDSQASVKGSGNSENSNSVTVSHTEKRRPVNPAIAPGLVAAFDCLGSVSGGAGLAAVNLSFGSTNTNEDCINVYLSRELERKGDVAGSWGVLCESEKVQKHSPECKAARKEEEIVAAAGEAVVRAYPSQVGWRDGYVRH